MTEDEGRRFVEIWRAELLRKHPAVAREVRRMRRGISSPSRIVLSGDQPGEED